MIGQMDRVRMGDCFVERSESSLYVQRAWLVCVCAVSHIWRCGLSDDMLPNVNMNCLLCTSVVLQSALQSILQRVCVSLHSLECAQYKKSAQRDRPATDGGRRCGSSLGAQLRLPGSSLVEPPLRVRDQCSCCWLYPVTVGQPLAYHQRSRHTFPTHSVLTAPWKHNFPHPTGPVHRSPLLAAASSIPQQQVAGPRYINWRRSGVELQSPTPSSYEVLSFWFFFLLLLLLLFSSTLTPTTLHIPIPLIDSPSIIMAALRNISQRALRTQFSKQTTNALLYNSIRGYATKEKVCSSQFLLFRSMPASFVCGQLLG